MAVPWVVSGIGGFESSSQWVLDWPEASKLDFIVTPELVVDDFQVDLASQVKEVHCATYHTCIVDSSDRLWVCGRDSSLCRDGQNHVYRPILFEPFNQPGAARGVRSLATVEQHTLVAAYPMSKPETVELWVWGTLVGFLGAGRCLFFLGFVDPRMILLRLPGVETAVEQDQAEA
eukprot:g10174.t1